MLTQLFPLRCCADVIDFQQEAEASHHGTDIEPQGVFDEPGHIQVSPTNPQTLRHFGYPAAILRLPQTVQHRALQVADADFLLFAYPVLRRSEEVFRLAPDEPELRSQD